MTSRNSPLSGLDMARLLIRGQRHLWPERVVLEDDEHLWIIEQALRSSGFEATTLYRMVSRGDGLKYVANVVEVDGVQLGLSGQEGWPAIVREVLGQGGPCSMSPIRRGEGLIASVLPATAALMQRCVDLDAADMKAFLLSRQAPPAAAHRVSRL